MTKAYYNEFDPYAAQWLRNLIAAGLIASGDVDDRSIVEVRADDLRGFWSDAEWLPCRDGKARPVEPGTFPLADGATARVGRLRAYGNAIVAPAAEAFIQSVMECI